MSIEAELLQNYYSDGAIPHRKNVEVNAFFHRYSVPILSFKGEPSVQSFVQICSGVLIRIEDMYFVFSAGHTVKEITQLSCSMAIENSSHVFMPKFVHSNYVFDEATGADYGYLQLFPDSAASIRAAGKIFAEKQRIVVPKDFAGDTDIFIICGYPRSKLDVLDGGTQHGIRPVSIGSTIASSEIASQSNLLHWGKDIVGLNLEAPIKGPMRLDTKEPKLDVIPKLPGMSGAGCWKANVFPDPKTWSTDRLQLAAIHTANTSNAIEHINGEPYYFLREVGVSHHLRLIARDYRVLRDNIYEQWPNINDEK